MQDESRSSSSSSGFNISGGGKTVSSIDPSSVGVSHNQSNSDSKWVNNQSSLIGGLSGNGAVTITADKTVLTGALLASATRNEDDGHGCPNAAGAGCTGAAGTLTDNGNLNLTTEVLEVNNLYDHNTSDSRGINLSVGTSSSGSSTLGLNHSGHNTQQTSFATLGGGTVQKKDGTAHDVATVNSDLNNTQEITQDQDTGGLNASFTLDHRLTSERGRDAIAEDATKSNMILNTIKSIITTERVGIEGFFSETQIQNQTLETLKAKIAADPELAAQLQNPDLTPAEKEQMLNGLTHAVMQELGYASEGYDNRIVAVDDPVSQDGQTYQRLGFYSDETNDAYINDAHLDNTTQLVTVAGHELSHAMDARSDERYSDTDNETYATNFGLNFANYTDLALDINGYDAGMASENGHRGYYAPQLSYNNQEYSLLDKSQGDSFGPAAALIIPAVVLYLSDVPTANAPGENENLDVIPQTTDLTQIGFDAAKEFTGHEWDAEIDIASMLGNPKTLVTDGIGIFNSVTGRVDSSDVNQISQMVDGASGSSGSIPSAEVPGAGTSNRPVIIGEDQYGRVDVFAKNNGGDTITDWLSTTGKTWSPEVNKEFISAMKKEGREFIDIGPAFDRRLLNRMDSAQGRPASDIYGSERKQLLDYGNRTQLYDRTGKYQGGIRGLDN